MSGKTADDIAGLEFDWLGSDTDEHVASFSTAGGGYAPEEYLRDTEAHDTAIDAILSLAASTEARFAPEVAPGLENTWRANGGTRRVRVGECRKNEALWSRDAQALERDLQRLSGFVEAHNLTE